MKSTCPLRNEMNAILAFVNERGPRLPKAARPLDEPVEVVIHDNAALVHRAQYEEDRQRERLARLNAGNRARKQEEDERIPAVYWFSGEVGRKVLDAIGDGQMTAAQISEASGISLCHVQKTLMGLHQRKRVRRARIPQSNGTGRRFVWRAA